MGKTGTAATPIFPTLDTVGTDAFAFPSVGVVVNHIAVTSTGAYPNLTLRTDGRMCNFCREITAYCVFDRERILPGTTGFATWKSQYRTPFYQRFGFKVPAPVPQTLKCPENTAARPVFQACLP